MAEMEAAEQCDSILASLASGEKIGILPNDFTRVLVKAHEEYKKYFSRFEDSGALAWGISGSGSAVFALYARYPSNRGVAGLFAGEPGIERIFFWE